MSDERIWQVRLPDGSVYVPSDSKPDDPRRSWIYSRFVADMFARDARGTVVEVTRREKEKLLDQEISSVLSKPTVPSVAAKKTKAKAPKTRARPFSREARRKIADAILESLPLNANVRAAVDAAREADTDADYNAAVRKLKTGLPEVLWIGYDPDADFAAAGTVAPVWVEEDPQGEDPRHWMQIDRDAVVKILVEDT